jgi:hypothetical protein
MVKFDEVLTVEGGVVFASGPFDPSKEEIVELCAWVYQRDDDDREDFAATEMTDHHDNVHHLLKKGKDELTIDNEAKHWRLPIVTVGEGNLQPGEAFAVAVAMIRDNGKQRVIWWGHPVMLKDGAAA